MDLTQYGSIVVKMVRDKGIALLHAAVEWGIVYVTKWFLEREYTLTVAMQAVTRRH